jgi:hypothetical protein
MTSNANEDFVRADYYSKTECCKILKVSPKRFKELVEEHNLQALFRNVECGSSGGRYDVTAQYFLKEDIDLIVMD